mmetsp:Transcript_22828/g.38000  ORF Transcript_22828/g.38000 Transcript_22828/m.38000 type:complete len:667 (+) Transcript_22828:1126-3126(+)
MGIDPAKFGFFVLNRLKEVILIVSRPGTGRHKVIIILGDAHDGVFRPRRPRRRQRIGQVDAAHFRQLVGGEPIQKRRGARPGHPVFGKGRGINQAHALAHRLGLIHSVLPPPPAPERPCVMIKIFWRIKRAIVIGPFPPVHKAKLRALGRLPVIGGRCAQGATRGPLLIRVVQDINVVVAFFVLARGELGGHPVAVAFGIQRGHVDLRLALDHHLGKVIPRATRRGDAKAKPFSQPHIAQTRRRTDQRIAIGRIANRPVEIVLKTAFFTRRHPVDHRHILLFDPLQIKLEEVRSETVGHTIFKARRRVFLVNTQDPAAALFADIGLRIRVPNNRMFGIAFGAEPHQFRVLLHHDELMLHRDRGHFDAQHFGRALRVVSRSSDHMFGGDHDLLVRGHQIAALLDHLGCSHLPRLPGPVKCIGLPLPLNHHTALARAFGHRHGHVSGIDIAVGLVIKRALQILSADQWPLGLNLIRGHKLIRHAAGLGRRGIEHIFVHACIRLGHTQVAHHGKTGIQSGFLLKGFIKLDGIVVNVGGRIRHVEIGQQPRRMPGGARGQFIALQQHDIVPSGTRQVIRNRGANSAPAHNQCFDLRFHSAIPFHDLWPRSKHRGPSPRQSPDRSQQKNDLGGGHRFSVPENPGVWGRAPTARQRAINHVAQAAFGSVLTV